MRKIDELKIKLKKAKEEYYSIIRQILEEEEKMSKGVYVSISELKKTRDKYVK